MPLYDQLATCLRARARMNETTAERHPGLLERELSRARAEAYKVALMDLEELVTSTAVRNPSPSELDALLRDLDDDADYTSLGHSSDVTARAASAIRALRGDR